MENFKKPYEISLWEDELIYVGERVTEYRTPVGAGEKIVNQYYKETKIAIIGSNTMDSPSRCISPKLVRKINGEKTLTFTMYYRYWDDETGKMVDNPFIPLMVNERKIKLRLGAPVEDVNDSSCQWFDFIVKNAQENSETKAFVYTCKDQFVNELSKSGFNLVFDNELENNMGTIHFLGEEVLKESDWVLDKASTDKLKQYKEEPLFEIVTSERFDATTLEDKDKEELPFEPNTTIYAFYSDITNKNKEL
jgi:hypothetical protein